MNSDHFLKEAQPTVHYRSLQFPGISDAGPLSTAHHSNQSPRSHLPNTLQIPRLCVKREFFVFTKPFKTQPTTFSRNCSPAPHILFSFLSVKKKRHRCKLILFGEQMVASLCHSDSRASLRGGSCTPLLEPGSIKGLCKPMANEWMRHSSARPTGTPVSQQDKNMAPVVTKQRKKHTKQDKNTQPSPARRK